MDRDDPRGRFYWLREHERPGELPGACLWLDDTREAPPGWMWATTAEGAIRQLDSRAHEVVSLDHDLECAPDHKEKTGFTVLWHIVEHDLWPTRALYVHSWNIYAADAMCDAINRFGPYERLVRPTPATSWPD